MTPDSDHDEILDRHLSRVIVLAAAVFVFNLLMVFYKVVLS